MSLKPKKIDLYIFKKFVLTFFFAMLLIIGITIIFDISEKIDHFVSNNIALSEIVFDYYVNFIPYFINMFSPLFVFITVIFFTSVMASNSEIIAILSGGISYHRMMVPYIVAAGIIASVSLGLNLWVIPVANQTRLKFEQHYIKKQKLLNNRDVHFQIDSGTFVYVEQFSTWNNTAYKFSLESIENDEIVSKLSAETATWDSTKSCWTLRKYFIRDYTDGLEDNVRTGARMDTVIPLYISDFYRNKATVQTLPHDELLELIEVQKVRGDAAIIYSEIEKHQRFTLPFSAFILTIMGVALSSRKKRGGIGWNMAIGIALAFSYILFMRFSQMFVFAGVMPAWIALWTPNILYALITAYLYKRAPK